MTTVRRAAASVCLVLCLTLVAAVVTAQSEKSLSWRALDVTAALDATGRLHIVERHAMVFTGDWNGGERTFRLFPNQQLALDGLRRIDPASGAVRALVSGNLDEVDRWSFVDGTTLRWRSRAPSDPPFVHEEIDYEIAYTLSGVLVKQGDTYLLDHNFGLPEADATIGAVSVELELDPVWTAPPDFARRRWAGPLPPGADFLMTTTLTRSANDGAALAVRTGTARTTRLAVFIVLLAGVGVIAFRFFARESSLGRFAPIPPSESIDAAWLEQRLFSLMPEEAGALWDDKIGAPEVTAVLARLSAEGKLETTAEGKEMTLRLKAPRESFAGYEGALIKGLFWGGRTETSTAEIRSHYKSAGFDPAGKVRPGLVAKLSSHRDFQDRSTAPSHWLAGAFGIVGLAMLAGSATFGEGDWGMVLGITFPIAFYWGVGLIGAFFCRNHVTGLLPCMLTFAWVPALLLWDAWQSVVAGGVAPFSVLAGRLLLHLAVVQSLFDMAKTRMGPKKIARRQELVAARRYLKAELLKPSPRIHDAWFPWLVALGLGPRVDRWFQSFGGTAVAHSLDRSGPLSTSTATSSSYSPTEYSGTFTGGGRSGGAGASASWAAAAGALASGVSAPSSSSSGGSSGGGGGGGGSSGGGGGGGW